PWISDGTAEGTYQLELCPGPCLPRASLPVEVTAGIVFVGWSPDEGFEVRATDGLPGIAQTPRPLLPGPEDGVTPSPDALAGLGGRALFFGPTDPGTPEVTELWSTDGTSAGTHLLAELGAGQASFLAGSGPNQVLFRFQSEGGDDSLWRTSGTPGDTLRLASLIPDPAALPPALPLSDSELLFPVHRRVEASNSTWVELWRTDGTSEGTVRAVAYRDLFPDAPSARQGAVFLERLGNTVYFGLENSSRTILWVTDGTVAGTRLAEYDDTYPDGVDSWARVGERLLVLGPTENRTFLLSSFAAEGAGQTVLESGYFHLMKDLGAFGEGAVFLLEGAERWETWETDGSPEGTHRLFELPRTAASSDARKLLRHGEGLELVAGDDFGPLIWRTDGTEGGTRAVDLEPET
ncbi:MAG: hypothetical protein KDD47_24790, partial [Acidobacteria bacterium]|nr:hypothetical protein [Acidobacteriota bacterium]